MEASALLPRLTVPSYWIALMVCALYAGALWALDAYTPPDVRHWQKLAELRGLRGRRGLGERVGDRVPFLSRLREELDIALWLTVSGSNQSTEGWLVATAAFALGAGGAVAAVDGLSLVQLGTLVIPLWASIVVMLLMAASRYLALRQRAREQQSRVGEQLADSLLGLAVLVPGIPADDALSLLARCQRDGRLVGVLHEQYIRALLGDDALLISSRDRFLRIGQALRIPMFLELSQLMRGIETEGLSPREEYPALSRISAQTRLSQNRIRAARAKTATAAAIALLLIPLLMLVGGGIAFAFLGAVNG